MSDFDPSKTMLKRIEQYRDRWTSYGVNTGLINLSDKMSVAELRSFDIFADYDDRFLEKISPDISVAQWKAGSVLFEEGSYINLAFFIVSGEVEVSLQKTAAQSQVSKPIFHQSVRMKLPSAEELAAAANQTMVANLKQPTLSRSGKHQITFLATMDFDLPKGQAQTLEPGEVFGEIGALSGWPQSVTAHTNTDTTLIQIRLPALRLMKKKSKVLKKRLDAIYKERSLLAQLKSTPLFGFCDDALLMELTERVELVSCTPGEVIASEGDEIDALYLIRSGFVKISQTYGRGELVVNYLSKGMTFGEGEILLTDLPGRQFTASSIEYSELVKFPATLFRQLLAQSPAMEDQLWMSAAERIKEAGYGKRNMGDAAFRQSALDTGLLQGSSMLMIDLDACTRCDDCVRACAATHDGRARFVREGNKEQNQLITRSCYHCRDPVCMVGCPTGAIHRAGIDDVVEINDDICIGCTTCSRNCPYDAIIMHETGETWPGDMVPVGLRGKQRLVASKCDLCAHTGHEPACVSNCPQGCATRVDSVASFRKLLSGGA